MKTNIYLLMLASIHLTVATATIHTVHVSDHKFVPAAFNAFTGDTVLWVWDNGMHTTTTNAANIPAGAVAWDEPIDASNQSFQYVIAVPGTYFYFSKLDGDMSASFTATGTLPVLLINFSVTNTANNKALISWNTVTEQNTSYFSIQRSIDAIKFIEIARINAAGNSVTEKSYSYTDNNIISQYHYLYYKIEIVDKDGGKQTTDLKIFKTNVVAAKLIISISPNPVKSTSQLNVQFNADKPGKMRALIFDYNGSLIKQIEIESTIGFNNRTITPGNLIPGAYKILFKQDDITETKTIVVQ